MLTTFIARTYLDMLGSRTLRREELAAHKALLVDSAGLALLVFLEKTGSAKRLVFVLHDMLATLFDQGPFHRGAIAIGDKEARKPHWPSRAQSVSKVPDANLASQPEVFDAFVTAARGGRSPHFLAVGPVRPVGAYKRGYANRRSRGTAVFADGLHGQRLHRRNQPSGRPCAAASA
jgi:hypothetical protein